MSATVLLLLGAVLCFLGAVSIRLGVLAAGFGGGWILAEVFDASVAVRALVGLVAALAAFVATLLVAKLLFFIGGLCAGAVLGAKLFVVADSGVGHGDPDVLLACIVVPAIGVLCGFLADRWQRGFLRLATAAAGAALLLSGVGRIGSGDTAQLWHPDSATGSVLLGVSWVVLAVVGYRVQRGRARQARRHAEAPAGGRGR
ncbi:DUF4203 domain-containing protein [Nocardioides sp. BP30]|uniref:TM7S3/TM198-like domain-containing protein n=1 Tax=Nocardioides sp. BP30 TaxID=3036374 RepID=UPI00246837E7|nr:DUF4203 domain-containing protein [Nocardioides sp. BP30]WGL50388.1 DUF4203 domain-containing protein [Nocardioides sp. BP30]